MVSYENEVLDLFQKDSTFRDYLEMIFTCQSIITERNYDGHSICADPGDTSARVGHYQLIDIDRAEDHMVRDAEEMLKEHYQANLTTNRTRLLISKVSSVLLNDGKIQRLSEEGLEKKLMCYGFLAL